MRPLTTRRQLLSAATSLLPALVASPALAAWDFSDPASGLRAAGVIPEGEPARALGRIFRMRFPAESSAGALYRGLAGRLLPATADAWRHRVAQAHDADLQKGRCLELDGWVVTPTEARLLALADSR